RRLARASGSSARIPAFPVQVAARTSRTELCSHRFHPGRGRLASCRLWSRCAGRCAHRRRARRRGRRTERVAALGRRSVATIQRPRAWLRSGRGRQRCLSGHRYRHGADDAGRHASPPGKTPWRPLGQAGLRRIRSGAGRRHAGACGIDVCGASAGQARTRLWPDSGCRDGRGRELRHHLCHGQGGELFPGAAAAGTRDRARRVRLPLGSEGGVCVGEGAPCRPGCGGGERVKGHKNDVGYPRLVLGAIALLLPTASLIPLGSLWLWEHGYVFYWAIGTCIVVAVAFPLQKGLIAPVGPPLADELPGSGNPDWTPRQEEAWDDVKQLAAGVEAERITSRDAAVNLALETIEVVARRLHPERRDPLWQFTAPEALAVVERASANLRSFLADAFPLSHRITVAQLMWLYRWRGALDLAEKGYDLWRVVRLLNPMAAATQELRERFTRQLYEMGRAH